MHISFEIHHVNSKDVGHIGANRRRVPRDARGTTQVQTERLYLFGQVVSKKMSKTDTSR